MFIVVESVYISAATSNETKPVRAFGPFTEDEAENKRQSFRCEADRLHNERQVQLESELEVPDVDYVINMLNNEGLLKEYVIVPI